MVNSANRVAASGTNFVRDKRIRNIRIGGRGREQIAFLLGTADINSDGIIYHLVIHHQNET